ncbi:MAG: sugar phosphate isomerase/epimerase [Ruminococcaceae bacterium]|nr:sugar phosphate isomerase/epimerase [Oscillospiraceae bacterium]MBQ7299165.1 sugar phosphate isomerase/epimerase [Clostridia bacterium]
MELGVLTNLYASKSLDETLSILHGMGVTMAEIGCGGYPGKAHCDPKVLLNDDAALAEFKATFEKYDMKISCLSCHGNAVHPDKAIAKAFHDDFVDAVLLAEKLGIDTIVTFSGCPGDHEGAKYPNWVTCPWPDDYLAILEWQWNEVLIPYWKETAAFAKAHGVTKIAFEMHPGFAVYNPETLMKMRAAVGDVIGANFDPSHLIWQGIEPVAAIRYLQGAIYHFHAKDTKIDKINTAKIGVLDTKHYGDELNRAWVFRACGYGNDATYWKEIVSALRLTGYDKVMSIEHEDSLMSIDEGLTKAVDFLKPILMYDPKPSGMAWA